jgi:hypothetical protein
MMVVDTKETQTETIKERTMSKPRNKRKTRQEMIEFRQAQLAKLLAQEDGTYEGDGETTILKSLNRALKTRTKALFHARVLIDGRLPSDSGKSPAVNSIHVKIANAQSRLDMLNESKRRAEEAIANLPFDIDDLTDRVTLAEAGEDVEFPNDLYLLPGDKTDRENEVNASTDEVSDETIKDELEAMEPATVDPEVS